MTVCVASQLMEVDCAGPYAAKQRRERRLRAAWKHEQLSVAMALAGAQHHSAPRSTGPETNEAPRGQDTAKAAGRRPDEPVEPGAQWVDAALSERAAEVPSLVYLPDQWSEVLLDSPAVRFLAKKRKEEEEKERERTLRSLMRRVRSRSALGSS